MLPPFQQQLNAWVSGEFGIQTYRLVIPFLYLWGVVSQKHAGMEITIKIDTRNKQAKALYEYLKTLPFVELEEPHYNKDTEKAIKEAKSGKTTEITLEDFRKELYT